MAGWLGVLEDWAPVGSSSAPLWIHGGSPDSQRELEAILRHQSQHHGGLLWALHLPWTGYCSYSGLCTVLDHLLPVVRAEAPELLDRFGFALGEAVPHLVGAGPRRVRTADAVVFAIVRRISRESHHSALIINGLAEFILAAKRTCPSLARPLTLLVHGLEYWDRPSIRVLYRLHRLRRPEDRIEWVAILGSSPRSAGGPALSDKLERARALFLQTVATGGGAIHRRLGTPVPFRLPPLSAAEMQEVSLAAAAEALADQNYERVYLLCQAMLQNSGSDEERAQAWRIIALADANLMALDDSLAALEEAARLTASPAFRAHLRYLQGLLCTKRYYDLAKAAGYYRQGESELESCPDGDPAVRLEKAWLLNGRALLLALAAKGESPDRRDELLAQSFQLEMEAYRLVGRTQGSAQSYLRYNLIANVTFLLEISHRFEEAIEFWSRAFEPHMAAGNPGFELAYHCRLGLLAARAGRVAQGQELLARAYATARELGDPFYEERVGFALAHVLYQAGQWEQAGAQFAAGVKLAADQRLMQSFAEHLAGALHCAARLQDPAAARRLLEIGLAVEGHPLHAACRSLSEQLAGGAGLSPATLEASGIRLGRPSPKLPAYIADIDLEGTPQHDLNRLLTDDGPRRLAPVSAGQPARSGGAALDW